jgi:chromosome segregation ATPase
MNDETNNGGESKAVLDEIQQRLDAHDLTQAEFQKMMMRFEFLLAKERQQSEEFRRESEEFRREIEASQARTQKHLEYITQLVRVLGDKGFEFDENQARQRCAVKFGG